MKFAEEIMEILAAFDLTGSLRDAGELAGCSHNTVGRLVVARDAGLLTAEGARRVQIIDMNARPRRRGAPIGPFNGFSRN